MQLIFLPHIHIFLLNTHRIWQFGILLRITLDASCEERLSHNFCVSVGRSISIHAPLARSDSVQNCPNHIGIISIHAPHARSDKVKHLMLLMRQYFNPRSSCEERRSSKSVSLGISDFNPHSSCEKRLLTALLNFIIFPFQSTLLMRGATDAGLLTANVRLFQSTPLMRGATQIIV